LVAAADSAHIRINLLHTKMPLILRAALNLAAAISLAMLALFLLYFTITTVGDTLNYKSIAQTPWATPLIYPQTLWLLAMSIFAVGTLWLSISAIKLAIRGEWRILDVQFGPGSPDEEVKAELEDLKKRQGIMK